MSTHSRKYDQQSDSEADVDMTNEDQVQWSNLIFLPFHNVFRLIVLCVVITKSTLGPIQSVYPVVYCWDVMDRNTYLWYIKYFYWYCCDTLYGIDTFLHIVHRQVTETAMRREHLPKPAFLLLLDTISLVPFFRLMTSDLCPPIQLWPNILAFSEFIIIYRVVEYFSLVTTNSFWYLMIGFTIMLAICINCATCFWLLLTKHGLCEYCRTTIYDWRNYVMFKLNQTNVNYTTYVYGALLIISLTINEALEETKPSTRIEFIVISVMMCLGYAFTIFVVFPKLFAEGILSFRRIFSFYPHVKRIISETKRRNPSPTAHVNVQNFYNLMWKKRSGITCIPEIISGLPRYIKLVLRQDLVWPVFFHSPSLRNTSTPFQRWLCEHIRLDYKLPGEKFFTGPHCHTNLYYLRSGVVQLMSADDGITPLLSVTSGTIFGDICFLIPPLKRTMILHCLTYCEVFILPRHYILAAMYKYPDDRIIITRSVQERLDHARSLYACKQHLRGLDRVEDEGVAWVKKRWWEIAHYLANWKNRSSKNEKMRCELPPEESIYHCAKYIGQLVLCTDEQLQTKSLFANIKFPWILLPDSSFVIIWHRIVTCNVLLVLLIYPPNLSSRNEAPWFRFFQTWTELTYTCDICVSLLTSVTKQENVRDTFSTVMFTRFKSVSFLLDVLATISLKEIVLIIGKPELYYVIQFNRLIKIYILFTGGIADWSVKKNPLFNVCYRIILMHFSFVYISGYFIYMIIRYVPYTTKSYFFGEKHCFPDMTTKCDLGSSNIIAIAIAWMFKLMFAEYLPKTLTDTYLGSSIYYMGYLLCLYCRSLFVAALYLKYRNVTNFQFFVSNLKKYYKYYKIHNNLLRRLDRYLVCHWKHYQGIDMINRDMLKNEPYDIYWRVHGEVAERIISESKAFINAEPALIRELAFAAKFLILPKNATLFLFGVQCKNVIWIAQGHIKCEYHNEEGELLSFIRDPGQMLSYSSVFFGKASLRSYIACTDCEILYIKIQDFYAIIKRYPNEWTYFKTIIDEFAPIFDEMYQTYVQKHGDHQNSLRDRTYYHDEESRSLFNNVQMEAKAAPNATLYKSDFWKDPDKHFMRYWTAFRAITVFVSIACASLKGGSGAVILWPLTVIGGFCDCIAWIDILINMFLCYYDDRGILITDKRMCMKHYLTRGFVIDLIGAVSWYEVLSAVITETITTDTALLINTICKFAHLYILIGYFGYMADVPSINVAFIMILKLHVVTFLVILGVSHYFISHCVNFKFDRNYDLISIKKYNTCWVPDYIKMDNYLTHKQLHILFIQSLNFAHCGLMRFNLGRFKIDRNDLGVGISLFLLGILYWSVVCYSVAILILSSRGNSLFQHGVNQLRKFLEAERIDKDLINSAIAHFRYVWIRTKGVDIHNLTNERIGVVFRQDLTYYFFRKTLKALNSLLLGGLPLERKLADASNEIYFLPGEEIVREMDLTTSVFVVHRGKVILSREGESLATLTKGGIFGILDGTSARPVRVSAIAKDSVDLLQININQFQEVISDSVRNIIELNPQSEFDYLATEEHVIEDPYDTVQYILRGRKIIQLPWMRKPMEARHDTWYFKWLYLVWLIEPVFSATISLIIITVPSGSMIELYWCLIASDILHLTNLIMEFYTMELTVEGTNCVKRRVGLLSLKRWKTYSDVIILIVPYFSFINHDKLYLLVRLLRLQYFFYFNSYFCKSFKRKSPEILLNCIIVFLFLHAFTCGWVYIACRGNNATDLVLDISEIPPEINITIDYSMWVHPSQRQDGCMRLTRNYKNGSTYTPFYVVPKKWQDDYIVALAYIIIIHTHTAMDSVIPLTLQQMYYKVIVNFFIYFIDIWLTSLAISAIYTKFREFYQYEYNVSNLVRYLNDSGLSPSLLQSVKIYTKQLWKRQRGNWLPELAQQAPLCLREDLFGALYLYHLHTPPLFRQLPHYFLRQLASRLQRIVLFPGKYIVQEGDIYSCMFFIHEGEVEKWYVDKSGESKLMSLLITNGHFGVIAGMFPNSPFQFSYLTRTVVDLVYLRLMDWQDLLDGYPEIKEALYKAAQHYRSSNIHRS